MAVHRELGPGLDEPLYHVAVCEALTAAGIPNERKPRRDLIHRGRKADRFEPDIVVDDRLIVECKALRGPFARAHLTQSICYLKIWEYDLCILLDFGKESLEQKRVVYTPIEPRIELPPPPAGWGADLRRPSLPRTICLALHDLCAEYGLGYRDTTYKGLLCAELGAQGITCHLDPQTNVRWRDSSLGRAKLDCIVIDDEIPVRVVALHDDLRAVDRAVTQSCLRHLGHRWGLVASFGRRSLQVRYVWLGDAPSGS